jgi:hypothetical protein
MTLLALFIRRAGPLPAQAKASHWEAYSLAQPVSRRGYPGVGVSKWHLVRFNLTDPFFLSQLTPHSCVASLLCRWSPPISLAGAVVRGQGRPPPPATRVVMAPFCHFLWSRVMPAWAMTRAPASRRHPAHPCASLALDLMAFSCFLGSSLLC